MPPSNTFPVVPSSSGRVFLSLLHRAFCTESYFSLRFATSLHVVSSRSFLRCITLVALFHLNCTCFGLVVPASPRQRVVTAVLRRAFLDRSCLPYRIATSSLGGAFLAKPHLPQNHRGRTFHSAYILASSQTSSCAIAPSLDNVLSRACWTRSYFPCWVVHAKLITRVAPSVLGCAFRSGHSSRAFRAGDMGRAFLAGFPSCH